MVAALGSLEGYKLDAYFQHKANNLPFAVVRWRDVTASVDAHSRLRMSWTERQSSLVTSFVLQRWAVRRRTAGWFREGAGTSERDPNAHSTTNIPWCPDRRKEPCTDRGFILYVSVVY